MATELTTYRERLERRLERRREWAASREAKAEDSFQRAHDLAAQIPLGQPILIGHHSEGRHRAHIAKIESAGFGGVAHSKMAAKHESAAAGIEDQLERSIFDDDPDAVERLTERIAGLEAKRDAIKAFNAAIRKAKTDEERTAIVKALPDDLRKGFSAYTLTNTGANIRRLKERLESVKRQAAEVAGEAPKRYRLLLVKYGGKCATCGAAIDRGATAYYHKPTRALYCYDPADRTKCLD